MPQYKVVKPGFYDSKLYSPDHPTRNVLRTDKPFAKGKTPSWLKPMKAETPAQKKAREKAEVNKATADADKAKEDQSDIDSVTFTESPGVETL